jgi:hypothetical protein
MRTGARVLFAVACFLSPIARTEAAAQSAAPRTVLMLHLGAETFPSNPILDAGVRETFDAHPDVPVAYYAEYLESDLFTSPDATDAFKDYIRRKYADRTIDLVIANTDTMLRFALTNRADLFRARQSSLRL